MNIRPIFLTFAVAMLSLGSAYAQTTTPPAPSQSGVGQSNTMSNAALSGGSAGSAGQHATHTTRMRRTHLTSAQKSSRAAAAAAQDKSPAGQAGAGGQ